jgi:hypothetical protein
MIVRTAMATSTSASMMLADDQGLRLQAALAELERPASAAA